jgi:Tfp pilus assembly protein PilF
MEQLSLSYKGLGQNKIATSYYKKALNLRKKD